MSQLLIHVTHLSKTFGAHSLFDGISLSISRGERFALIGENGSGKTTLLRILLGDLLPDSGHIERSPSMEIGFLPQEVVIESPEMSVEGYLNSHFSELEQKMAALEDDLDQPKKLALWATLQEEYERKGGYRRPPLEKVLRGLKLQVELSSPMSSLSSGERVRVALAKALIDDPDLLLLDEPTNHLDQEMREWLKETIRNRLGATIIISHDRSFINETCNRLIEIQEGKLTTYGGNYDFYLEERKRLAERKLAAYEEQQEELAMLKQKIKGMSFSKGKAPPPSDQNIMAYDRRGSQYEKSVQRTLNELKARLQEIEANPLPHPRPKTITGLRFAVNPLPSEIAIEFEDVGKAFAEKKLFSGFSHILRRKDRILLQGPNGSGKTTLLKCVLGLVTLDSGSIKLSPSIKIAYLDQEANELPLDKTPLVYFRENFGLSEEELRRELHKTDLGGYDLLHRPFSDLSTGQRKRLMLLKLVLEKPNVLLLDEPTNHLDLLTIEAFEKSLTSFEGAILAVSHDERFIEKIASETWTLFN